MSKTIINLAFSAVSAEAEEVLETYPHHPYQQAFSAPDLRQKLISYVLSRIPSMYVVVEENQEEELCAQSYNCYSEKQRNDIEALIRQGIRQILQDEPDWVAKHIPGEVNSALQPSNWFG
jgi:hypothetical protein